MSNDQAGSVARQDELILRLGNQWLQKNIGNRLKRAKYTSQVMRLAARMLMHLQMLEPTEENTMWNYLKPEYFTAITKATLLTAAI